MSFWESRFGAGSIEKALMRLCVTGRHIWSPLGLALGRGRQLERFIRFGIEPQRQQSPTRNLFMPRFRGLGFGV